MVLVQRLSNGVRRKVLLDDKKNKNTFVVIETNHDPEKDWSIRWDAKIDQIATLLLTINNKTYFTM